MWHRLGWSEANLVRDRLEAIAELRRLLARVFARHPDRDVAMRLVLEVRRRGEGRLFLGAQGGMQGDRIRGESDGETGKGEAMRGPGPNQAAFPA